MILFRVLGNYNAGKTDSDASIVSVLKKARKVGAYGKLLLELSPGTMYCVRDHGTNRR